MKYLAIFLLAGLGFASAYASDFDDRPTVDRPSSQNFNIKQPLQRFRKLLSGNLDIDTLVKKVESLFGKDSVLAQQIIDMLRHHGENGKQKILDFIDRMLEGDGSITEVLGKLRDIFWPSQLFDLVKTQAQHGKQYLNSIHHVLGEKEERSLSEDFDNLIDPIEELESKINRRYRKFGEWLKKYSTGFVNGKSRAENLQKIAKEFMEYNGRLSKDVAEEALNFFREYKEDIGNVFDDIKEKVKDILKED